MKKVRYILFFLACLFISPIISRAECSYQRTAELSRIAGNVQLSYNYGYDESEGVVYNVHLTNVPNDIFIRDEYGNEFIGSFEFEKNYSHDYETSFWPGDSVKFYIYSNDDNCREDFLLTKSVYLPDYNDYSLSDDCMKYPNFEYCKVWMDTSNIDDDVINKKLLKYISSNNSEDESKKSNVIFTDYLLNKYTLISATIVSGLIIYVFIRRKVRK